MRGNHSHPIVESSTEEGLQDRLRLKIELGEHDCRQPHS